jgi:cytidylate kinase
MEDRRKIGVVGPCAAGKSTLIAGLKKLGYDSRHIAQEHSYTPHMWKRITDPDVLIFLDVSFEESMKRRKLDWSAKDHKQQQLRLAHARQNADLYLNTDSLTIEEVFKKATDFLRGLPPP